MFARLLILFITIPVVELILFITLGEKIGIVRTFGIILVTGILGAWLTRLQGMRTLVRYQQAMNEGRLPHEEVMDGLMILLAGAVLLTPGFLTDTVGFLLLVPVVRGVVRKWLLKYLKVKIKIVSNGVNVPAGTEHREERIAEAGKKRSQNDVIIEAEVIEETQREE